MINDMMRGLMNLIVSTASAIGLSEDIGQIIFYIIIALFAFLFVSLYAVFGGWGERKVIGRSHSRLGPNMTGPFGLLQTVADVIKFMTKSVIFPKGSDKKIFVTIPGAMMLVNFTALLFVPFGSYTIINSDYSLLIIFALLSLGPTLMMLGSWASNSKYSTLGGLRGASLVFVYEVLLSLSIAGVFLITGSFSIAKAVQMQSDLGLWFIVLQPLGFVLFLMAMIASFERNPFDMTEADSELVSGWRTEYGGIYFAITLFAEYAKLFIGCAVIASVYLGGWLGFLGEAGFFLKIILITILMYYVRAASMRWRLDHLLARVWNFYVPLALLNFLVTYIVLMVI
jgi:NADH-quinone oxidoreductase subunit H